MKVDMDKIQFESRQEVSLAQNALEIAIASGDCNEDEVKTAKELSALLDAMWYNW